MLLAGLLDPGMKSEIKDYQDTQDLYQGYRLKIYFLRAIQSVQQRVCMD